MTRLKDAVDSGCYAQQQIHSRDRLIAWSHRGRFRTALTLGRQFAGQRVLDYGCGDGTLLGLLLASGFAPRLCVGAEIGDEIVRECQGRFDTPGLRFVHVNDLKRPEQAAAYDAVFCMEVFEHVVDPAPLLADFERLLVPGGSLVVSVPIETGVAVVIKQAGRRVAGWRGIGDYPGTTGYTPGELVRSVFAGSQPHIDRPVFRRADGSAFHDHKGFNWRVLRAALAVRFDILRTLTSPVSWLGPQLATQVWFVARRRALPGNGAGRS